VTLAFALVVGVGSPPGATAQVDPTDWIAEPLSWHGEVAAGGTLTLVNAHGDLRVRGKQIDGLEIVGFAQHHLDDPRPISVEPEPSGGGWRLEVTMAVTPGEEVPADWSGRRVDLTVYVPWKSPLTVRTDEGVLEALDLGAPLQAETVTGDLLAGSSEGMSLRSRSGTVGVVLEEPGWSSTATIETVSGAVSVHARPDADATVTLATRGTLTTDFSLEIERVDASLRRGRARLGAGTGEVLVTSYQGAITLREVVESGVQRAETRKD
jgi:hypothetical protein